MKADPGAGGSAPGFHNPEGVTTMRQIEMFLLFFFLALSVGAYVSCSHLPVDSGYAIGPGFMPKAMAVLIALAVLVRIVELLRAKGTEKGEDRFLTPGTLGNLVLVVGLLVLTAVGMGTLGVYVSVFGFMLAVLLFVSKHRFVPSIMATLTTTGVFYLIFAVWLKLPLPSGLLF